MTAAGVRTFRSRVRLWLPAVAIVVVAWLVFWMAQGFSSACNLVAPCPGADAREAPALLFGGIMLIPLLLVASAALLRNPVGWLITLGYVALVALAVGGYGAILFSAGFVVDLLLLIGALAVGGTAWFAFLGVSALQRDS